MLVLSPEIPGNSEQGSKHKKATKQEADTGFSASSSSSPSSLLSHLRYGRLGLDCLVTLFRLGHQFLHLLPVGGLRRWCEQLP